MPPKGTKITETTQVLSASIHQIDFVAPKMAVELLLLLIYNNNYNPNNNNNLHNYTVPRKCGLFEINGSTLNALVVDLAASIYNVSNLWQRTAAKPCKNVLQYFTQGPT